MAEHKYTGLRCPACEKAVAEIERILPGDGGIVMRCPACGNRWSAEPPGVPTKH